MYLPNFQTFLSEVKNYIFLHLEHYFFFCSSSAGAECLPMICICLNHKMFLSNYKMYLSELRNYIFSHLVHYFIPCSSSAGAEFPPMICICLNHNMYLSNWQMYLSELRSYIFFTYCALFYPLLFLCWCGMSSDKTSGSQTCFIPYYVPILHLLATLSSILGEIYLGYMKIEPENRRPIAHLTRQSYYVPNPHLLATFL